MKEQSKELNKEAPKKQTTIGRFSSIISTYEKKNLVELLETHNISPSQFKNIVVNELKKSPKMQEAFVHNPSTLFASILHCAELGLNPSSMVGDFYFIPFKKSIKPILGYKGLLTLLLRSGEIFKIWSEVVYKGDEFSFELGLEPTLKHIPNLTKRGSDVEYVYTVAKLRNGETMFKVMSKQEILEISQMAQYQNDLFFNKRKDPQNWMAKKTVLKQLSKLLPKDYYGKKGISMDDSVEGGGTALLDENGNVLFKNGKQVKLAKKKGVYGNLLDDSTDKNDDVLDIPENSLSLPMENNTTSESEGSSAD